MEKNLDNLFSRYMSDSMSDEERKDFDYKLTSDDNLKAEFDNYRIGMIAGRRIQYHELKDKVGSIIKDENKINKSNRTKLILGLVAAAAIIGLFFYFFTQQKPKTEQLFAQYYTTPPYGVQRGGDTEKNLDDALIAYSEKNWIKVISTINQLPIDVQNDIYTQKLKAHTYMASGQQELALPIFKKLAHNQRINPQLENYWHQGLAFLGNQQIDSSIYYFDKIVTSNIDHPLKSKALELMTKLK